MIAVRHAGIVVRNMESSIAFYCGQLGFRVARRMVETGPFIAALLGAPGAEVETAKLSGSDAAMIELLHFRNPLPEDGGELVLNRVGPTHVALTVSDLDALHCQLVSLGILFNTPPLVSPDGKAKVAFCRDPEGNYLELVEMVG